MSKQGTGTVLPTKGPRQTGGQGHVNVGGQIYTGTNLPGGLVRTPDGKIHGSK